MIVAASTAFGGTSPPTAPQATIPVLEPGRLVPRDIRGNEVQTYRIAARAGQFYEIVLHSTWSDVALRVVAADGVELASAHMPGSANWGTDLISFIADRDEAYTIEVRQLPATPGHYEIYLRDARQATARERELVDARAAATRALSGWTTSEEWASQAAPRVEEAVARLERAGDGLGAFVTMLTYAHSPGGAATAGPSSSRRALSEKSLPHYERALEIAREAGLEWQYWEVLIRVAVHYRFMGDAPTALRLCKQVAEAARKRGDRMVEAWAFLGMSGAYGEVAQDMKNAARCADKSIRLCLEAGAEGAAVILMQQIGRWSIYFLGDPQYSYDVWWELRPLARRLGAEPIETDAVFHIGFLLNTFGDPDSALPYLNEALDLARTRGDVARQLDVYDALIHAKSLQGDDAGAMAYCLKARDAAEAAGDPNRAWAYRSRWASMRARSSPADAIGPLTEAAEHFRSIGWPIEEGAAEASLGRSYVRLEQYDRARLHLERSLPLLGGEFAIWPRTRVVLSLLGEVERAKGNHAEARMRYEQCIALTEAIRGRITGADQRAMFLQDSHVFYVGYMNLLLEMHAKNPDAGHAEEAFRVAERLNARSLRELIVEGGASEAKGMRAELLDQEARLQRDLASALERQIVQQSEEAAGSARRVQEVQAELAILHGRIQRESPMYGAFTHSTLVSIEEMRTKVLDPDTLVLEYVIDQDASFLFAVSSAGLTTYRLPENDKIEKAVLEVRRLLTGAGSPAELDRTLAELSRMVLGPATSQLGAKRLVVVPDGLLHIVPFAALPDPASAGTAEPLIARHEIAVVPSASLLAAQRNLLANRRQAPKSVAVLADPVFARDDERVVKALGGTAAPSGTVALARHDEARASAFTRARLAWERSGLLRSGEEFVRLRGTRIEAERIARLTRKESALLALDWGASERTARSAEIADYRIVHFATHGFLNPNRPELSGLVLSLVNERGEPEDGFLSAPEVAQLRLGADLVVLSGCETGIGKNVRGEGPMGLTRAFMYAGAPRVVASLWAVRDNATAELMTRFYEGMLKRNLRPAAALREAQLAMLRQPKWRSPRDWAAFVFHGEWR